MSKKSEKAKRVTERDRDSKCVSELGHAPQSSTKLSVQK